MMTPAAIEGRTFRVDTFRLSIGGAVSTVLQSVFLIVAIKRFDVGDGLKSTIAAASSFGLIGSLFYAAGFAASGIRRSTLAAVPLMASGVLMTATVLAGSGLAFTLLVVAAAFSHSLVSPFLLAIYADNYRPDRRGRLYSVGLMLSLVAALVTGLLFGVALSRDILLYRPVVAATGLLVAVSGGLMALVPSGPSTRRGETNPLRNLLVLFSDGKFGLILLAWFISGFSNLWSQPVRVSYLAEAGRGLDLSPMTVLLIMSVIPSGVRLLFTRVWAHLFDRFDFLVLRVAMTLVLGLGVLVFLLTANVAIIVTGTVIHSIGFAGTFLVWNLWITKIAPPGRGQLYMSVHSFLTGVRGILGPYLGYLFIGRFTFRQMGLVSFGLNVVSALMMVMIMRRGARTAG